MNLKLPVVLFVVPLGLLSILTKPAAAADRYSDRAPSISVDQHPNDRYHQTPRANDRQYNNRRYDIRNHNIRRDEHQLNYRKVWIPGHYEPGFLGIGRYWVDGYWQIIRR
jgi:hypothetical protein